MSAARGTRRSAGHYKRTATQRCAASGLSLRVAPTKRVCGVVGLGNGITIAFARRLASIALSGQRAWGVKSDRLLGYCFGGSVVLEMARLGLDLDAVVSYHGSLQLSTPAEPGRIKARVAVFTGEADPMIPPAQVEAFRADMEKAGARVTIISYPGVKHSFTNPAADQLATRFGLPLAYDRRADEDSWSRTDALLKETFGRGQ